MTPLREIVDALLSYAGWPRKEHWLAELVVKLVEEREENFGLRCPQIQQTTRCFCDDHFNEALRDFGITPEQFEEIKKRLENDSQQG